MSEAIAVPPLEIFRSSAPIDLGDELGGLDAIADVQVTLSMEVGRATITVRHLLQFTAGSVVELDRGIDEPFDVFVNGTLLARGEPVVVDELCGVRLTSVIPLCERRRFTGR
jgi:flagellar motor switch protein FliN/FliY